MPGWQCFGRRMPNTDHMTLIAERVSGIADPRAR